MRAEALIPITIGALVLFFLFRLVYRGLGYGGVREPSCGSCGYPVRGLGTFACPECGRDLREAGIVTPSLEWKHRPGLMVTALSWAILATALFLPLAALGLLVVPEVGSFSRNSRLVPASGAYTQLDVTESGGVGRPDAPAERVLLELTTNDGATATMDISRRSLAYTARTSAGSSRGKLTESALRDWLRDAGAVAPSPDSDAQVTALTDSATSGRIALPQNSGFLAQRTSTSVSSHPPRWYAAVVLLTLPAVWAVGLLRIIKVRRERQSS
jgi:hypothetical protein